MVADLTPAAPTVAIVEANADGETYAVAMRLMAAVALGCGFLAAPMVSAAGASAFPVSCDGTDVACVPYIERGAVLGDHCVSSTRYNLGLDSSGATLACGAKGQWVPSPPLVGVRALRTLCGEDTGVALSADGVTLSCIGGAWSADYRVPFA
jgi:hypothetical protein